MADENEHVRLLKLVIAEYQEIARLTELLVRVEIEERENLVAKRGEIIDSCHHHLEKLKSLGKSHSKNQLELQLEQELETVILSVVAQDQLVTEQLSAEKDALQLLLPAAPERSRAVGIYQLHSRH